MECSSPERKKRRIESDEKQDDDEETWSIVGMPKEENNLSQIDADASWSVTEIPCGRWCQILDDGGYRWDDTKLECFLSQEERKDLQYGRNLVCGMVLSAKLYPLIFDTSTAEETEFIHLRSLSTFEQLLADGKDGESKYQSWTTSQKRIVAVGVRDLFLANSRGLVGESEQNILCGMIKILDETAGCTQARGMQISCHPTTSFKVLKFIEDLDDMISDEWKLFFAQVMDTPKLFAVFVDPVELSFHNFENIIPLDRWIESKLDDSQSRGLSLSFDTASQVKAGHEIWTCQLKISASNILKELSSLDLYVAPPSRAIRGGERFIFHSALLSKALTKAVRSSEILAKLEHGRLGPSFEFVNYVFRCNRFALGDAKFASHRDTPYYDSAWSQVSKYTLLIYLTAGHGDSTLRVNNVEINGIEEMTCIIFDQSYEHEGRAFIDGEKVFLRSELIFEDKKLDHSTKIASLFSEACYMTGQDLPGEDLASYAHDCFERANSLHWAIDQKATQPEVYLHKQFRGIQFMTNGYDYWFLKDKVVTPKDCGMVAVLDFFNCKLDGHAFRSLSQATAVREHFDSTEAVLTYLASHKEGKTEPLRRLAKSDVESLFKTGPDKPFIKRHDFWENGDGEDEEDGDDREACCPFHCIMTFDAWTNQDVHTDYKTCCDFISKKLFGAPLLVLNQELVINQENIKIVGNKMFFVKGSDGKTFPRINFAACWNGVMPHQFIGVDHEISAPDLMIPPTMLHEFKDGYHLVLDFFRNDWMIRVDDEHKIPVPVISNDVTEGTMDDSPFISRMFPDEQEANDFSLEEIMESWK